MLMKQVQALGWSSKSFAHYFETLNLSSFLNYISSLDIQTPHVRRYDWMPGNMIGRNIRCFMLEWYHTHLEPGLSNVYTFEVQKTMKEIGVHQRFSLVEEFNHPKFGTISICLIVFFLCFIFIYRKGPSNRFVIHQKNMCFKIFLW